MTNRTKKKTISRSKYLELMGLQAVFKRYLQTMKDIEKFAQKITGEVDAKEVPDHRGLTSEMLFGQRDIDDMLKGLELKVIE